MTCLVSLIRMDGGEMEVSIASNGLEFTFEVGSAVLLLTSEEGLLIADELRRHAIRFNDGTGK